MDRMTIGWTNRRWVSAVTLACTLVSALIAGLPLAAQEAAEDQLTVPWNQAIQHVGEEVTIEGRIVATHASPLSTLLSFDQGFNQFTAVIRPADRDAFPPKPEEYYRGKLVRIAGRVVEYDKKAEIILKSRAQIQIIEQQPAPVPAPEQSDDITELALELLRRLTAIESSLEDIADRLDLVLTALERQAQPESPAAYLLPGRVQATEPPPRPRYQALRSLKRGMAVSQVEQLMGTPVYVDQTTEGGETWYYGGGRVVTFDRRGRVEATAGFQRR